MSRRRALHDIQAALTSAQSLLAEHELARDPEGRGGAQRPPQRRLSLPAPDTRPAPAPLPVPARALPGLLEQCRNLLQEAGARPAPLRCVQHLACTGGTLIARCIAALPNTRVLSEVDPLSDIGWPGNRFFPSNVVGLARFGSRPPDRAVLLEAFLAGLEAVHRDCRRHGLDLVVRGHGHSQFHTGPEIPDRPGLPEILATVGPVRAVVTVRHPVESYLSLRANGWLHFTPATAEEYALRYHAFLDRHADLPLLRYEEFLTDPDAAMVWLCDRLELRHDPDFRQRLPMIRLSGDSGRRGDVIGPRPRRPCPKDTAAEIAASQGFTTLLERLGYEGV